jgi:IclR family transcriptional regulator, pca regulon regulatory protein
MTSNPTNEQAILDERLFMGGLAKGLGVLDIMREHAAPMTLTELAARSKIGRSGVQRILHTLSVLGYLRKDPQTRRYLLAPKVLDFACGYLRSAGIAEKASPYLLEASKRTDETVNLTEPEGFDVIYVSRYPSRNVISADLVIGSRLPMFCTAPGRAILAQMPLAQARDLIDNAPRASRTLHTIVSADDICRKIDEARSLGYALANQEAFIGDISVAAAVVDRAGTPIGAVNIAVSASRWSPTAAAEAFAPIIIEVAGAVSKALGRY